MPLPIPPGLDAQRRLGPAWAAWLDRLPRLAAEVVEEWQLVLDGAPMHGYASLAQPVRTAGGRPAVLKVAFDGDDESLHEGIALQRWHGDGAVSLLRADPHRRALLLERLHTEDLGDLWDVEACEVVAGLYGRLHVPALPQLRTVTSYVEGWAAALARMPRNAPVPRRLVEQALSLARDLVADDAQHRHPGPRRPALRQRARRRPRAVAGHRPQADGRRPALRAGAPAVEPLGRADRRADESVRDGVRRRFHTVVDAAGLDEDRARDWVVVRMVLNAHWSVQDAERAGRDLDADEREWITRCIAIAKAVQD